jgi:hydrogenase small subunit
VDHGRAGCDGDTVSITAASEPSIEDVLIGAIPGLPKVHLHNPVLAVEVGDDFMKFFHQADRGEIDNFVLVLEGSIPNEKINGDGYWAAYGNDPKTGQPIRTTEWIDRLAPKALAVVGAGTCATYGGIHAMQGNPTGCMGLQDYLGRDWKSKAGLPIVNVPGCPVQPDNFMETLLYLLRQLAGLAPMIPVDELGRPRWLFGNTVHNGCDRAAYYEQADFTREYGSPNASLRSAAGARSCNAMCPNAAGFPGWGAVPMSAAFASAARCRGFPINSCPSWTSRRAGCCRRA